VKKAFQENRDTFSVVELPFDSAYHSFERAASNCYPDSRCQTLWPNRDETVFLYPFLNFSHNILVYRDWHSPGTDDLQNTARGLNGFESAFGAKLGEKITWKQGLRPRLSNSAQQAFKFQSGEQNSYAERG
jgi:hypothetical protein